MTGAVAEDVKQNRPLQGVIAVNKNVEHQVHKGAQPVTDQERNRIDRDNDQQQRHQLQ
jgi:hypothetical protein